MVHGPKNPIGGPDGEIIDGAGYYFNCGGGPLHCHDVWDGQEHDPECPNSLDPELSEMFDPEECCDGGQAHMESVICHESGTPAQVEVAVRLQRDGLTATEAVLAATMV